MITGTDILQKYEDFNVNENGPVREYVMIEKSLLDKEFFGFLDK